MKIIDRGEGLYLGDISGFVMHVHPFLLRIHPPRDPLEARLATHPQRVAGGMLAWSVLGFSLGVRVSSGYNFRVGGVYAGNRGVRVSLAYKKTLDICTTSLQP